MNLRPVCETLHKIEEAEGLEARGHGDRARRILVALADTIDATSEPELTRRCLEVADRLEAYDVTLHCALSLWCALPGHPHAHRTLMSVALFHPNRRVAGAGYRVCRHRARLADWCALASADPHAEWPEIRNLCGTGRHGGQTLTELRSAGLVRAIGADGIGVWVLGPARVTRVGRSIAIGVDHGASGRPHAYVPPLSVWDPSAALKWLTSSADEAHERVGLLATRFSYSGYWHWLMEGLVHAVRLDEVGLLAALNRLIICADASVPRVIAESLQAVGIDDAIVFATPDAFDWSATELVVPMRAPGFGGLVDETDSSDLGEIRIQNAKYDNGPDMRAVRRRLGLERARRPRPWRRLFVSRRDATKRRIANEAALLTALRPLGFEPIVPGGLTFAEQVTMFSSAELVVGPHGAGLANALFMPRGSAVLELHHTSFRRPYYRRLAQTLALQYEALDCDPDPRSPLDMMVDVDSAVAVVRSMLNFA